MFMSPCYFSPLHLPSASPLSVPQTTLASPLQALLIPSIVAGDGRVLFAMR